jgi:membrane protein implicated in regulation of membrane protease activity
MDYTVYWVFFIVGTVYAFISAIFAGMGEMGIEGGDIGHDMDVGHDFDLGHDLDFAGDVDVGDLDVGHVDPDIGSGPLGEVHLPAVSPITIGAFLATSGGTGIILKNVLDASPLAVSLLSAAGGFIGAAIVFLIIRKMVLTFQGSSEAQIRELIGIEGELITPIVPGGTGEIAYVSRGSRYSAAARATDAKLEISRGTAVTVKRIVGNTFFVTPVKYKDN